ncbi:MAG: glucose 1-dehydrogenase [Myxococcales bacterium]|nr:glucose 1-dehydrogenase [Myxococcales bacterium]
MSGRLQDKVAIITGGARGQGAAEGQVFAREGARVVLTDILDEAGEKQAATIGGRYLHHNVTREADWERVVSEVLSEHGRVDVLINNAGIFQAAPLRETTLADWEQMIAVNQTGVMLGMRTVAGPMCEQQSGSIVNISSVAGLEGPAQTMAYSATKWAVRGMTKVAAAELGRYNVRVNSIHPGLIDTDMLQDIPWIKAGKKDRIVRSIPMKRDARPEEVANLALFLASDESSYCTSSEFIVDGGAHR